MRNSFLATALICTVSALLFAVLRYGIEAADDFSAFNHPAQPWALDLHIASSVGLSVLLGLVFGVHVLPRWSTEARGRNSGRTLLVLATLMVASGALLPVCAREVLRSWMAWIHGVSGAAFALGIPWHLIRVRAARKRTVQGTGDSALRTEADFSAPRLRARGAPRPRASLARDGIAR